MESGSQPLNDNVTTAADLEKRPEEVAGMFDLVAKRYDLTNDVMTFGQHRIWRRSLSQAIGVQPGEQLLDIAAGTGTSSIPFQKAGAQVTACDFSAGMIEEGRRRYPELEFLQADAHDLPFADHKFDVVTCSFGFRNMHDPNRALAEFYRVTKPGGRLVIMEFSTPPCPVLAGAYRKYMETVLPRAGRWFSSDKDAYDYLVNSILDWPEQEEIGAWMQKAGWKKVQWRNLTFGTVAIHRGVRPL